MHGVFFDDGVIDNFAFKGNQSGLDRQGKATLLLTFPSGGDNSYPGFVVKGKELWVSYYSGHEGRTSIYLAKLKYKDLFVNNKDLK